MSNQNRNRIVGAEANGPKRNPAYTLRTDTGVLVRVGAKIFQQAVVSMRGQSVYLNMSISTEPTSDEDAILACADVIELESRLAKVKKEAAELSAKLAEIAS